MSSSPPASGNVHTDLRKLGLDAVGSEENRGEITVNITVSYTADGRTLTATVPLKIRFKGINDKPSVGIGSDGSKGWGGQRGWCDDRCKSVFPRYRQGCR